MDSFIIIIKVHLCVQLLLSISIILLNGPFMIALVKTRSLHSPSNAALGCLCCSDLLIGIVAISLSAYGFWSIANIAPDGSHIYFDLFQALIIIIGLSSLFMTLVNLDRYVAVCHPYKYLQYATPKLYAIIFISTTLIYAVIISVSSLTGGIYRGYSKNVIIMFIIICTLLLLMYCTFKEFQVIRRHRREISSLGCQNEGQQIRFQYEAKQCQIVVLLVFIFAFCKIPNIILYVLLAVLEVELTLLLLIFSLLSDILLFLNCVLNPIVYYFRIRAFRNAMKAVLHCQRVQQQSRQDK